MLTPPTSPENTEELESQRRPMITALELLAGMAVLAFVSCNTPFL